MSKNNQEYEMLPHSDSDEPRMTKNKALKILHLTNTASLQEIGDAYDALFAQYSDDAENSAHLIPQITTAKAYLDKTQPRTAKPPVITMVEQRHAQGRKALEQYQLARNTYFTDLAKLITNLDRAANTYLTNIVGKDLTKAYTEYQNTVKKLTQEFHAIPQLLEPQVLTPVLKTLIADDVLAQSKNNSSAGGPVKIAQDQLKHLSTLKNTALDRTSKLQHALDDIGKDLIELNTIYQEKILLSQEEADIDTLQDQYKKDFQQIIVAPLNNVIGPNHPERKTIEPVVLNLALDIGLLGDTHLKHQALMASLHESTDARVQTFLNDYDDFLNALAQVNQAYPEFQPKFDKLAHDLYLLGSQYLLAIQQPDADDTKLRDAFNTHYEKLILNMSQGKDNIVDKAWDEAWEMINPVAMELFLAIHTHKIGLPDPIALLKDKYGECLQQIKDEKEEYQLPEHRAVFDRLNNRLVAIGETYFDAISEATADIDALSAAYQRDFKAALNTAQDEFKAAGAEMSETWPKLNMIFKILATIVYCIKAMILAGDAKKSEHNRLFTNEKDAFNNKIDKWISDSVPDVDQAKLIQYREKYVRK